MKRKLLNLKKLPEVSNGKGDDACVKEKRIFPLKKETISSFSFRQCPLNQQHHLAVWCFGHHATSWDVALVSPFTKWIKESMEEMFLSLICFYLFFLYIFFGTFFGQGIASASQRGVKQCNQNMESDILRQHGLALSPWPSKAFKLHTFMSRPMPPTACSRQCYKDSTWEGVFARTLGSFQVFLSYTNNFPHSQYMVSSNYSYLIIIIICL